MTWYFLISYNMNSKSYKLNLKYDLSFIWKEGVSRHCTSRVLTYYSCLTPRSMLPRCKKKQKKYIKGQQPSYFVHKVSLIFLRFGRVSKVTNKSLEFEKWPDFAHTLIWTLMFTCGLKITCLLSKWIKIDSKTQCQLIITRLNWHEIKRKVKYIISL